MLAPKSTDAISYVFPDRPDSGAVMPLLPGIFWLRMPLPFALGNINLWLLEDGDGWAIVDTGVSTDESQQIWQSTLAGTMADRPVTRIIVTHLHPDHAGCAGWLTENLDVEFLMSREEYLLCRILVSDTGRKAPQTAIRFYKAAGYSPAALAVYQERFGTFGRYVSPLPESYRRLKDGDVLTIGEHPWEIVVGRGHSPEHACLYCADLKVFISGDQLLPTISSNVSVHPTEPAANPLSDWMNSLRELGERLPEDVLVLPAHGKPFRGARTRLNQLIHEHDNCLAELHELCKTPRRAIDTFPALFKSKVNDSNLIFATGESIAHLNFLLESGRMTVTTDKDDIRWYQSQ